MNFQTARERLNRWHQFLVGRDASTNKRPAEHQDTEAAVPDWWQANDGSEPDWRNSRTVAYLVAYLDISGPTIPLEGIPLDDGFMRADRAVIRSLLAHGCLEVRQRSFHLTPRGEALIAPLLKLSGGKIEIGLPDNVRTRAGL